MVNRVLCLSLLLLMLGFVPASAQIPLVLADQAGQPIVEVKRLFAHFDWRSDGSVDAVRRVRPLIFVGHGTCRGKFELNLAVTEAVNHENGNWLEIAALECALSSNTRVSMGRLFLAAPYSTPPPFLLRTVEYPKANTFAAYGYGMQVARSLGSWNVIVDVTGNSGRQFDDSNFDHVESSLRIGRKLGAAGTLSFTSQLSADNTRVALDWMSDSSQDLNVWAGVYYDDGTTEELLGMVQISYPIGRRVRPHGMWDHRPTGIEEWTFGTEVLLRKEVRVVVDYEVEAERFLSRLQFHW